MIERDVAGRPPVEDEAPEILRYEDEREAHHGATLSVRSPGASVNRIRIHASSSLPSPEPRASIVSSWSRSRATKLWTSAGCRAKDRSSFARGGGAHARSSKPGSAGDPVCAPGAQRSMSGYAREKRFSPSARHRWSGQRPIPTGVGIVPRFFKWEGEDMLARSERRAVRCEQLAVEPRVGPARRADADPRAWAARRVGPPHDDAAATGRDLAVRVLLECQPRRVLREAMRRVEP